VRLEPVIPPEAFAAIREPIRAIVAHPLDPPVIQPLGLLLDLLGEELRERLFIVQGGGGPESCLRTDFTLAALRAHLDSGRSSGRYYYRGHAFRVAPVGTSRSEEFPQIGLEVFETGDPATLDAEMAALAWRSAAAGGRDDLTLLMGDVGLFAAFVDALGLAAPLATRLKRVFSSPRRLRAELTAVDPAVERPSARGGERLAALLSGLSEAAGTAVLEDIWGLAGIEPVGGRGPAEIVHRLAERAALAASPRLTADQADLIERFLAIADAPDRALAAAEALVGPGHDALTAARQAWGRRMAALVEFGVPPERVRFSAAFGRAFGYYDGVLFEVRSAALGDEQPVAAGGRYDGLAAKLGESLVTGAVGCMVRPGRAWAGAS
jgi:ATP phosphoribosyltransferase regulatory subunit